MENMVQGLSVTVIGIAIVMLVLFLLSASLGVLKLFSDKPVADASDAGQAQPEENNLKENSPKENNPKENNLETVAVITAALAAHLNTAADGLVVRSIRKVPSWNEAIRRDQQRKLF